jgi:hypothetical protein
MTGLTQPAFWDISSECQEVASSPPDGVESGISAAGPAAGPNRCRVRAAPGAQPAQGCSHRSPVWPDGTERPIHRPKDPEEQQDH